MFKGERVILLHTLNFDDPIRYTFGDETAAPNRSLSQYYVDRAFDRAREPKIFQAFYEDYIINEMDIADLADKYALSISHATKMASKCRRRNRVSTAYVPGSYDQWVGHLPEYIESRPGPFGTLMTKCPYCDTYLTPSVHDVRIFCETGNGDLLLCPSCKSNQKEEERQ
jgi:hypothetical protein